MPRLLMGRLKRFLKVVGILALFATALAYVAFRSLFFDPFEGPRASIDTIVPSNVDVFVRRKGLERDFEQFPMPEFFPGLRLKDEWKSASRTAVFEQWRRAIGIEPMFVRAEKIPDEIKPL